MRLEGFAPDGAVGSVRVRPDQVSYRPMKPLAFSVWVLAMLSLCGCGESPGEAKKTESTAASRATAAGEIVVGEYGSLTGNQATFGIGDHDGITLATEECNAAGGINGRKVRIICYDDQGKSTEAITAVTRLIQEDKVVAIL